MKRFAWWANIILLSVLTLALAGPVCGDGSSDSGSYAFTDYGSFLGEYLAAGALKFYDNTEEILRLAQFEHALMRYRFLKGQIQRKHDYYGLTAMIDLRLKFLKQQLHLSERDIAAIPPRKARIPKPKTPAKPASSKDAAAKPKPKGGAAKKDNAKAGPPVYPQPTVVLGIPRPPQKAGAPPVTAAPRGPGAPKVTATPPTPAAPVTATPPAAATPAPAAAQKSGEVVTTDSPPAKEEKAQEETKPPVPLSFWDKLRIRLNLKKGGS
jgi:hypothetical protein